MHTRTESTVTTLVEKGALGERFEARIEGGAVDVQIQTAEAFAGLRLPLSALEAFADFIDAVRADPAAVVAESSVTQEEATNG